MSIIPFAFSEESALTLMGGKFRENRTFSGDESLSTSRRVPSPTVSIVHGGKTSLLSRTYFLC